MGVGNVLSKLGQFGLGGMMSGNSPLMGLAGKLPMSGAGMMGRFGLSPYAPPGSTVNTMDDSGMGPMVKPMQGFRGLGEPSPYAPQNPYDGSAPQVMPQLPSAAVQSIADARIAGYGQGFGQGVPGAPPNALAGIGNRGAMMQDWRAMRPQMQQPGADYRSQLQDWRGQRPTFNRAY